MHENEKKIGKNDRNFDSKWRGRQNTLGNNDKDQYRVVGRRAFVYIISNNIKVDEEPVHGQRKSPT